jgi:predicted DNA-binding protein with PD1-like motif
MTSQPTATGYILRLKKDELLCRSILDFVHEKGIKAAWLTGIGGAQWAEIGFYHPKEQTYAWKKIHETLEIASLQGNIAWESGEPVLHLHGVFADRHYVAYGGHVKEAQVAATCEINLQVFPDMALKRSHDDEIGLHLLDL